MPAHRREPSVELGSAYRRESERSHGSYGGFGELLNHPPPPRPFRREREDEHDDLAGRRWIDAGRPERDLARRFPGDGFDFRRPVMSAAARGREERADRFERQEVRRDGRGAEMIDMDEYEGLPDMWNEGEDDAGHVDEEPRNAPPRAERVHAEPRARVQRLPHYDNAIIDLVSDDEDDSTQRPPQPQQTQPRQWRPQHDPAHHPRTSALRHPRLIRQATPAPMEFSTDLEFMGSNPITRQSTPATTATQGSTSVPTNPTIDLTAEDDDDEDADLFITETRPARPGINNTRPDITHPNAGARDDDEPEEINYGAPLARLAGLVRDRAPAGFPGRLFRAFQHAQANDDNEVARNLPRFQEQYYDHQQHLHETQRARARQARLQHHRQLVAQRTQNYQPYPGMHNLIGPGPMPDMPGMPGMPGMMDYGAAAFDLGLGRQPSPTYEAPKEAEKGFTMSPGEEEIVVCPNCGDELAVAGDGEKGQVWVIRGCGHAYCGTCMANRNKPTKGKGKARATEPASTLPFKSCVVEGCKRKVTARDVIHVYMSS
ncbi:hypothetical protein LTR95_005075 [Oleoguttula sp. CCFEE 5521]